MPRFLQLHMLTFYPPANLNRDDTGRPKSAVMGGVPRLRVSSQSLKRAWRTSDLWTERLVGHLGERTQRLGEEMLAHLVAKGVAEDVALKAARDVAALFGKLKDPKDGNPARTEQLAFVGPEERKAAMAAAERVAAGEKAPKHGDLLLRTDTAVDIGMFGRMLAASPDYNREAAVQVAHAITTHRAMVEDDFYTAVDDLKLPAEDSGAGFVGEAGFGSGVFYVYACIDLALLAQNLGGNDAATALAAEAVAALVETAATVGPNGKQASFASRARAHYLLAERGDQQPRSLAGAFVPAVDGGDTLGASVTALRSWRDRLDRAYGDSADATAEMDVRGGRGTLAEVITFCREAAEGGARG